MYPVIAKGMVTLALGISMLVPIYPLPIGIEHDFKQFKQEYIEDFKEYYEEEMNHSFEDISDIELKEIVIESYQSELDIDNLPNKLMKQISRILINEDGRDTFGDSKNDVIWQYLRYIYDK